MTDKYDDPHWNHDPFIDEHDDAAEAKADAQDAGLDPEVDDDETRAAREKANAAVDADTADKAEHLGVTADGEVHAKHDGDTSNVRTGTKAPAPRTTANRSTGS